MQSDSQDIALASSRWRPFAPLAPQPLPTFIAIGTVLAGVLLFASAVIAFDLSNGWVINIRLAFMLTPLFALPIAILLFTHRHIRWTGLLFLLLGLAIFHWSAIETADSIFPEKCHTFSPLNPGDQDYPRCHRLDEIYSRDGPRLSFLAGFAGGALGAALSFATLALFGTRFRGMGQLIVMAAATLALGASAAFGFAAPLPDEKSAWDWVLQLYVVWQTLFGLVLLWLYDRDVFRALIPGHGKQPA